jgi:predicted negative regulator of RcsB-dependent stress response
VLGRAASGSDTMLLAQLRLARVLAAQGDTGQALAIIESADPGSYGAAYQMARGDILLMEGQNEAAREAYDSAMALAASSEQGQVNLATLEQKLQSLSLRELPAQAAVAVPAVEVPQGDQ